MDTDKLVEGYLEDCRLRNFTSKTVTEKGNVLKHLFCRVYGGEFTEASVRGFLLWLKDVRKVSERSQRTYLLVLKACIRHLNSTRQISASWVDGIIIPKVAKTRLFVANSLTIKSALDVAAKPSANDNRLTTNRKRENYEASVFLLMTGMRIGELMSLTPKNFDFVREEFWVQTEKTQHIRYIPIFPTMKSLLSDRMSSDKVFGVSKDTVNNFLHQASRLSHLSSRLHAHTLRHAFATDLLRNGAPIERVADLLGHEDLNITRKTYGHLVTSDYRFTMSAYHPLFAGQASFKDTVKAIETHLSGVLSKNTSHQITTEKKDGLFRFSIRRILSPG